MDGLLLVALGVFYIWLSIFVYNHKSDNLFRKFCIIGSIIIGLGGLVCFGVGVGLIIIK